MKASGQFDSQVGLLPVALCRVAGTNMFVEDALIVERAERIGFDEPAGYATVVAARWFVLHVKSRQEKALAADLVRARIEHYLPLNRVVRYHGRRKAHVIEPLFSGYLFLKGVREQAFAADRTRRVASIIDVPDQARFETELKELRQTLDRAGFLAPTSLLTAGVRVEVIAGPFKGMIGHIASLDDRNRLVLHVTALGQGAALELNGSLVRAIDE